MAKATATALCLVEELRFSPFAMRLRRMGHPCKDERKGNAEEGKGNFDPV
jgi:hypothetical protein